MDRLLGTAQGAHPLASETFAGQIGQFPRELRQRIVHVMDGCGPRIAQRIIDVFTAADRAGRLSLELAEVQRLYEASQLSHTDLEHDDGFVRRGAENHFLEKLGIAPEAA